MRMVRWALMVCVLAMLAATMVPAEPLLKPGERLVFLGDDITEQFVYTRYVMTYFTLRYPGAKISFRNAAWNGNTAADAQGRLTRDVLSLHPAVVSICLGMNDGHFAAFDQAACDAYLTAMTGIVDALKKENIRVVLLSPGCVDPERRVNGLEYNATLAKFTAALKGLADKEQVPFFDLNALMLSVQTRAKQADAHFTLAPDALRPNSAGHLVIAYALLKALGCTDQPSALTIDAPRKLVTHDDCTITDLSVGDEAVTFTRNDAALPAFIDSEAAKVLPFLPFNEELNQYRLQIIGLKDGDWKVTAGDFPVGTFSAGALGKGVNLGMAPGPWMIAGAQVAGLCNEQEFLYLARWRQIGMNAGIPPEAHAELEALLKKLDANLEAKEAARERFAAENHTWKWSVTFLPPAKK